jgi:hypothetical protein
MNNPDAQERSALRELVGGETDAKVWLERNGNEHAFASNHFGDANNARLFVDDLYELGAEYIEIAGVRDEPTRIRNEGGPYADELIVAMPNDADVVLDVMTRIAAESPDQIERIGPLTVRLWWD